MDRLLHKLSDAIIMFMTGLGGALSVSIGQNIFATVLVQEIPKYTTLEFSRADILSLGATQIRDSVPLDQLEGVLEAFTQALKKTFLGIPILSGSVCVLLALAVSIRHL